MARANYGTITVPRFVDDEFQELVKEISNNGMSSIPKKLIPNEFKDNVVITRGMILLIAVRAARSALRTKKDKSETETIEEPRITVIDNSGLDE